MNPAQVIARLEGSLERPGVRPRMGGAPRERGDYDLNSDYRPEGRLTPAAVLVPLIRHPAGMSVLLTLRTDHLNDHAGQVSFPGGKIDPADTDAIDAALRETHEEVGIEPELVEVVGRLDDYITGTGFTITPVVGLLTPGFTVTPDPFEVADVFEVPLDFFLDTANHHRESRFWKGRERHFYVMPYEDRYIWGATAGMLVNLYDALKD
ncbi:MAG TPA: CoA pyrophosphatase [Alphaproteobacteria bacterium]|nr:CoA pyrophosphatase [Alphaproteobacteria bacterium]